MLQRLLTRLGFGWYLPQASDFGNTRSTRPDTDGQVTISPVLGRKVALTQDEAADLRDEDRERLTDSDLVWPGKVETIALRNDEEVDYRFNLSIVNLDPPFYSRRPAQGGRWQPDGSVLLTPGEETAFEVVFQPPPADRRTTLKDFRFVVTRFDPRRATDPGEVFGELLMRWVPLPSPGDLKIAAKESVVLTRPWRRTALFELNFLNKSLLPPSVALKIVRAQTKEKLGEEAEQVGALQQSLESRTPCAWHCLLPAGAGNYYASVTGEAQVGDEKASQKFPLALSQPVQVRYVPWLRMGKDWLFLGVLLFALMYAIIGIPLPRTPVATVDIADKIPAGVPVKVTDLSGAEIKDAKLENGKLTMTLPSRWGGNRFPFGWSWLNRDPGGFKAKLAPGDKDKDRFSKYGDLTFRNADGKDEFRLDAKGDWNDKFTAKLPRTESFFVLVKVKKQGALKPDEIIKVAFIADGEQKDMTYTFRNEGVLLNSNPFDLSNNTDNESKSVLVKASTEDKGVQAEPVNVEVKRQPDASVVELVFNSERAKTAEEKAAAAQKTEAKAEVAKKEAPKQVASVAVPKVPGSGGGGGSTGPKPPPKKDPVNPPPVGAGLGIGSVLKAFDNLIHSQDSRGKNEALAAKTEAEKYLGSHADDPKALAIAGYAQLVLGEKDDGLKRLQAAIDKNEYLGYVCMLHGADLDGDTKQKYAIRVNQAVNSQTDMPQKAFGHSALWEYYVSKGDPASADLEMQNIVKTDPKQKP